MQKLGTAPAPWLEQLTGAGRGRIFEFDGSRMSIGRSDDNQIVIQDDSVSRVHALIEQNEDGSYVLFDNGSRNGILVNGSRTDGSVISDGDTIQIGNVSFRLSFPNSKGHEVEQRKNGSEPPQLFTPPQPEAPKKPGINRRFILYGGVLLVLGFLYFSSVEPENSQKATTTEKSDNGVDNQSVTVSPSPEIPAPGEAVERKMIEPGKTTVETELENLPWTDSGITESEAYFRRGQREYFNKNYHRAISSFELALSLNRTHPEARFYLAAAIHDAEAEAKKNFEMGLKYFAALQYTRAIYHFQQTQSFLMHKPKDKIVGECEKYIRLSRQRLQAAELFP